MRSLYILCLILSSSFIHAQMPDTDIWLFDLEQKGDSFILSKGMNITDRPGYDNQPSFSPDNKFIYYTSYRDGQSDIYRYELAANISKPFGQTPESEYSPTVTPDGKFVSVVRVEKDSTQRLWKFPITGGPPLLVFKNIDSIGYHCWMSQTELMLFLLGNPEKIVAADTRDDAKNKTKIILEKGGRSLHPGYLVSKQDSAHGYIANARFTPAHLGGASKATGALFPIIETIRGNEDFAMHTRVLFIRKATPVDNPDSHVVTEYTFFMGSGSFLYKYTVTNASLIKPVSSYSWKFAGDLTYLGIKKIGRIAISPDGKKIAIVSTR